MTRTIRTLMIGNGSESVTYFADDDPARPGDFVEVDGRTLCVTGYNHAEWQDDLDSGRVRVGGPHTWYDRIEWSPAAWAVVRRK